MKRLLLEALWVMRNAPSALLEQWIIRGGVHKTRRVIALLILALSHFQYTVSYASS